MKVVSRCGFREIGVFPHQLEQTSGLGGADASVVALAERLRITDVATIDRRHFQVIRPAHCSAFTLLPEL